MKGRPRREKVDETLDDVPRFRPVAARPDGLLMGVSSFLLAETIPGYSSMLVMH